MPIVGKRRFDTSIQDLPNWTWGLSCWRVAAMGACARCLCAKASPPSLAGSHRGAALLAIHGPAPRPRRAQAPCARAHGSPSPLHGGNVGGLGQAYPKVTCKLVRGWPGDNERRSRPGGLAGVGVSMAGRGRRGGISRAFPGRAVRRKPIGCGAAGTGGRGATWRCSAGTSGMPPVRAAGGS